MTCPSPKVPSETPVTELGFTRRTLTVLERAAVTTVGELAARSSVELGVVRGAGTAALHEIETGLRAAGYRLADSSSGLDAVPVAPAVRSRLAAAGFVDVRSVLEADPQELLKVPGVGAKTIGRVRQHFSHLG